METIVKPWGKEELLTKNLFYAVKKLYMKKGCRCSLQFHNEKMETVVVIAGVLKLTLKADTHSEQQHLLFEGDFYTVKPGVIHRMEAVQDVVYLEASTPQLDDLVRIEDDYRRVNEV